MTPSVVRESAAPADLADVVRCTWAATFDGEVHQLVPDACVDLVWRDYGAVTVCGPETEGWSFTSPPGSSAVGLRLHPGTAALLLGAEPSSLREQRVPLEQVVGDRAARRLRGDRTPDALLDWARDRRRDDAPDPVARGAVVLLDRHVDVAATARELGLSHRQFHRRAVRLFGYGPSMLHRILRVQAALALLRRPSGPPLAQVASLTGFADQAHLTREFGTIAGVTPAQARVPRPHGGRLLSPLPV